MSVLFVALKNIQRACQCTWTSHISRVDSIMKVYYYLCSIAAWTNFALRKHQPIRNLPTQISSLNRVFRRRLIRTKALSICTSNILISSEMIEPLCTPSPEIWCLLQFATNFCQQTFAGDDIWLAPFFSLCVFHNKIGRMRESNENQMKMEMKMCHHHASQRRLTLKRIDYFDTFV